MRRLCGRFSIAGLGRGGGDRYFGVRDQVSRQFDAWWFSRERRHYYDYLAALLQGTAGSRTLKQIFEADAKRYGRGSVRGRLSQHWVALFQAAGGDLYATWFGAFPVAELALLRGAQQRGNETLIATLEELSRVLGVLASSQAILRASLLTAGLAILVLALTLLAVPEFTVPRLRETFALVPAEYHGAAVRSLFDFADGIGSAWPIVLPCLISIPWLIHLSFKRYGGRLRPLMDRVGPWRIYRQVQALRFLALLAVALGRDPHGATRLRNALVLQLAGGASWMVRHVADMLENIDAGRTGADIFDTGLLDPAQLWFLGDMTEARGLVAGLRQCSDRVESHVLGTVARQAGIMRWCLLLTAVSGVLAVGVWHYVAIDELRRALALFYASQ